MINAELLMFLGGTSALLLTLHWVRGRDLREKYALVWLAVAFLLFLGGLFPDAIKDTATALRLQYSSFVLMVALTAIYVYAFTVSVSLTRQYRRNVRLIQELALLEERVRRLEGTTPPAPLPEAEGAEQAPSPETSSPPPSALTPPALRFGGRGAGGVGGVAQ
jgi:hypothetical protein